MLILVIPTKDVYLMHMIRLMTVYTPVLRICAVACPFVGPISSWYYLMIAGGLITAPEAT